MSNKYLFSTLLACFLLQVGLQNIQAQDYPASPLEKEGYRLIFHDEFEGKEIDRTKWIPEYLPSWPKDRTVCTPTYEMKDGVVRLTIDRDSKNEFDKGMYISGFMSASRTGMHHYDPKRKALHSIKTEATQINQYGYYEMRAKMQAGGGVHCAWWLIGFEDDPNQSCEIDIFEILGTDVNRIWSTVHSWKDSTIQYHTEHPWFANKKLAEEFHVYPVYKEPWVAMIPKGHPLYVEGTKPVRPEELLPYDLLIPSRESRKGEIDKWFNASGQTPLIRGRVAHMMNAYELSLHGVGVSIYPESISALIHEQDVCVRKVDHPDAYASYALIWKKNHTLSHVAEEFISFIQSL